MGWTIFLYDVSGVRMDDESFELSNLTSHYCAYTTYWDGMRDFHQKTVGDALAIMQKAIITMFSDGILPLKWCERETKDNMLRSMLYWLISTSIDISKFPKEWTLKLI